jgi:D-sedoheptulose 7-phosphate isomerase
MSEIKKIIKKTKNFSDFSKKYFNYLNSVFKNIDSNSLKDLEKEFSNIRKNKKTLFIIGNGGGAATATTMANDLGFDILKKTSIKNTFKIHSLTDNTSVITAIANDTGYENVFINQLKIHHNKGDGLLILSASGNSKNLLKAAEWVKKRSGKIIGILGFDGGKLKKSCDICIHLKTGQGDYGPVEDLQLVVNHILAHWFQEKLKKRS